MGTQCALISLGGQALPAQGVGVNAIKRPVALNDAVQIVWRCNGHQ